GAAARGASGGAPLAVGARCPRGADRCREHPGRVDTKDTAVMMKNVRSVRTKVLAGFLLMCVVTGVLGVLALNQMGKIFAAGSEVTTVRLPIINTMTT